MQSRLKTRRGLVANRSPQPRFRLVRFAFLGPELGHIDHSQKFWKYVVHFRARHNERRTTVECIVRPPERCLFQCKHLPFVIYGVQWHPFGPLDRFLFFYFRIEGVLFFLFFRYFILLRIT